VAPGVTAVTDLHGFIIVNGKKYMLR